MCGRSERRPYGCGGIARPGACPRSLSSFIALTSESRPMYRVNTGGGRFVNRPYNVCTCILRPPISKKGLPPYVNWRQSLSFSG